MLSQLATRDQRQKATLLILVMQIVDESLGWWDNKIMLVMLVTRVNELGLLDKEVTLVMHSIKYSIDGWDNKRTGVDSTVLSSV